MFTYGFVGGSLNETSRNVDDDDSVNEHDDNDDDNDKCQPTTIPVTKKEISDEVKKPLVTIEPYVPVVHTSETEDVAKEESTVVFPEPTVLNTAKETPGKSPTRKSKKRSGNKFKFECTTVDKCFSRRRHSKSIVSFVNTES